MIAAWMAADESHHAYSPDLFFKEDSETFIFMDEQGPILIVNVARALRAFVQFAPNEARRTRVALPEAFGFVKKSAKEAGFRELIFDSVSKRVIAFCKKRLGFSEVQHDFRAYL
jgi:hypothetical protein